MIFFNDTISFWTFNVRKLMLLWNCAVIETDPEYPWISIEHFVCERMIWWMFDTSQSSVMYRLWFTTVLYAYNKMVFYYECKLKCLSFCFLFLHTDFTTRTYIMFFMFICGIHFVRGIQRWHYPSILITK